jgi:hypothetical protein
MGKNLSWPGVAAAVRWQQDGYLPEEMAQRFDAVIAVGLEQSRRDAR